MNVGPPFEDRNRFVRISGLYDIKSRFRDQFDRVDPEQ
jgi:hypothetical protein